LLIDHISFRRCCYYLNEQSHQRNDIGPRSFFRIRSDTLHNFERIASLHPYYISYSLGPENDTPSINAIWSRITSLRQLWVETRCDPSHILLSQTGLTWLHIQPFSPHIRHCTKLLDLTIPLPLLADYKYLPSSLTRLNLLVEKSAKWSFQDDKVIDLINHLSLVSSLELIICGSSPQSLSSLSRWLSLTKLIITNFPKSLSLDGLIHHGSYFSIYLSIYLFTYLINLLAITNPKVLA
jgi:hypothetical protein